MTRSKKSEQVNIEDDSVETPADQLQHPSEVGETETEIAKRSTDTPDDAKTDEFTKVYVLRHKDWDILTDDDKDRLHQANIASMRQFLINQGLRPLEDGEFSGDADHEGDPASVDLAYTVKVLPAVIAPQSKTGVVRVNPDDSGK